MSQVKVSQLALLFLAMTFQTLEAQLTPKDWLDAHNVVRFNVRLFPLVWDNAFASFVQKHVNEYRDICVMKHSESPPPGGVAMNSYPSAEGIVEQWVQSKGHYANLVSPKWTRIGCASVRCTSELNFLISCNYGPPAEMNGEMLYSEDIFVM